MMGNCPLCAHSLREHEKGRACSAAAWTGCPVDPLPDRTWSVFTNRCKHRDREQQPYPWPVAVEREKVCASS